MIVVVGGGVAGLIAAWELSRGGLEVALLERSGDLGGAVARHRVDGLDLDAGADSFAVAGSAVSDLISDLGLTDVLVTPNPVGAWVVHDRGAAPLPAGGVLGIPAHPWAQDTRRALGTLAAARAGLDALLPRRIDAPTVGGLARRRMGRQVVRRLVEPVAGGVYSVDPDRLEVATVQPRLPPLLRETGSLAGAVRALRPDRRPGSAVMGLRGGMFELVRALERACVEAGVSIRRNCPVERVEVGETGVRLDTGAGEANADGLVLAADHPDLLPRAGLARPHADVLLVTLVLDAPALDAAPRGTGVLVASAARGVRAKALTHATAKWAWLAEVAGPDRHVVRLSYGRGLEPVPEVSSDLALRDASGLFGVHLTADMLRDAAWRRWSSALPTPELGHQATVARLRGALPARMAVTGAWVAGTGLAAVVADSRRTATAVIAAARNWAG